MNKFVQVLIDCTILETTIKATNYVPNWNDIFADDWMVVENEF